MYINHKIELSFLILTKEAVSHLFHRTEKTVWEVKFLFSKDEINKAIAVIKEEIDYIKLFEPNATVEIENLEFAIISLEGYRDRESFWAM